MRRMRSTLRANSPAQSFLWLGVIFLKRRVARFGLDFQVNNIENNLVSLMVLLSVIIKNNMQTVLQDLVLSVPTLL